MWILYIAIAIVLATGTGVYISSDIDIERSQSLRIEEPQIHAQTANQVSRALRQIYFADPTLFPDNSNGPVRVPNALVSMANRAGMLLPPGVSFELHPDGSIRTVFDSSQHSRNINADTFERVIALEGINPQLAGRRAVIPRDSSNTFVPVEDNDIIITDDITDEDFPDDTPTDPGTPTDDGSGSVIDPGDETDPGDEGDITEPGTSDPGDGSTETPTPEPEPEPDTAPTSDEIVDDLTGDGGTYEPVNPTFDPDSFIIEPDGTIAILDGFESLIGPEAEFYSQQQLEALVEELRASRAQGSFDVTNYQPVLYFEGTSDEAQTRNASELEFLQVCGALFEEISFPIEDELEAIAQRISTLTTTPATFAEDIETIGGVTGLTVSYCASVLSSRERGVPTRANLGNSRNLLGVQAGTEFILQYAANPANAYLTEENLTTANDVSRILQIMSYTTQVAGIIQNYGDI